MNEIKILNLLLVSREKGSLSGLASSLKKHNDVVLSCSESGEEALDKISKSPVDLVVTDQHLGDMTGLELVLKMLSINPMVNCAAISSLSHEDFHEAAEGLGLLAQLPPQPGEKEAGALLQQLRDLKNLTAGAILSNTE